ncbi:MAG TPA: FecR family protein, partial [Turneriella sp.]|nr:FecR family protein [Turneriella sp.]
MKVSFLAFLVFAGSLFAVEGRVTYLTGKATIKSGKKSQALKLGGTIREGDVISTAKDSRLGVQMSDGGSFLINPMTTLEVRPKSTYYQAQGAISMNFRKGGKDATSKWAIKTPVVTAGVRGTSFTVDASKKSTRVVMFQGKVIMTDFVRETGLQSDANLMMQDFLNDIELHAGTALRY